MTLPAAIQRIVDEGITAARVLEMLGEATLEAAYASSMGYGILQNCNFTNYTDDTTLHITEATDGRVNVHLRYTKP